MSSDTDDLDARTASAGDDLASLAAFQDLILARTHDLITVIDPVGTVVYGSPAWRTLGWDPDLLVGKAVLDLLHPDDRGAAAGAIADVLAGGSVEALTVRLRAGSGDWAWYESSGAPISGSDGGIAYIVATARDVSEREELRRRVSEVDALYRVAEAISRATTLDELLAEATDILIEATTADRAAVLLYDDARVMRFRASRGLSAAYREAAEGHSPWTPDDGDPQPVLIDDLAAAGFPEELEQAARREGIEALAFVPLVHGGRLLGKFMLYRDTPQAW